MRYSLRSRRALRALAGARCFAAVAAVAALSALGALAACGTDEPGVERASAREAALDDFGDTVTASADAPARIVSLNPATTELLFAIGAGARLVGRTSYDLYPAEVLSVPDLGPGLRPNVESVLAARPDLVVLYASADNRDAARRLRAAGVRTVSYRVDRLADFERVTLALGTLVGDVAAAHRTVDSVRKTLDAVRRRTATLPRPTIFWPLWESPLLSVGGGSFLNELVVIAGGRNVFAELVQPSPVVSFEELVRRDPDLILAGPRSRERMMKDARWSSLRAVRAGRILVVDTTMVNGPSPRVGASALGLARLLHPDAGF